MANILAIVGRPNVGKSTLFNRLVEKRQAIMDNVSGVTRDRHYGYSEWTGKNFTVVDTGGYVTGSEDKFESEIRKQVEIALEEANVVIFMVDCIAGLTGMDEDFARVIRSSGKPVFLVANKADTPEKGFQANEFYSLGLGEVYTISSANGHGTGELLDKIVTLFDHDDEENPDAGIPRFAILGRPNAGKSSLLNALVGKERTIVTDEAGTTRDSIDTHYKLFGKDLILSDTAGIRRKSRVRDDIEFYSVMRALTTLQDADVCIIMVDAERGLESQDVNLISLAHRYKKGMVILVNKWDLIEKNTKTSDEYKKTMDMKLGEMNYIPVLFTSVVKKQRIFQALEKAMEVYENRNQKIPTSALNEKMLPVIERNPPPAIKGKYIKIKYITQLRSQTPTIAFFCNHPQYIKDPYKRFLENQLRNNFSLEGVPVQLFFRKK